MNEIKNLLFDFGGVFYEIDPFLSIEALNNLGIPVDEWLKQKNHVFYQLEKGEIANEDFMRYLQVSSSRMPDYDLIINAFNKMLIGLPLENVRMLSRFSRHYNCYLVSNTNDIHFTKFSDEILKSRMKSPFYSYFIKEYYSFQLGLRKPDIEIFKFILNDTKIKPEETLFVDDDLQNVLTAASLHFQCFNFGQEGNWAELIAKFNLKI